MASFNDSTKNKQSNSVQNFPRFISKCEDLKIIGKQGKQLWKTKQNHGKQWKTKENYGKPPKINESARKPKKIGAVY